MLSLLHVKLPLIGSVQVSVHDADTVLQMKCPPVDSFVPSCILVICCYDPWGATSCVGSLRADFDASVESDTLFISYHMFREENQLLAAVVPVVCSGLWVCIFCCSWDKQFCWKTQLEYAVIAISLRV